MTTVRPIKLRGEANAAEVCLLRSISNGDRSAFDKLFTNYHSRLFTFLFRLTRSHGAAEELANDVLLTLWNDAGRFRGDSKVSTWIFGIAYRKALAHLKKGRVILLPIRDEDAMESEGSAQFEREDWVRRGIDKLPAKQKLTVMLVYFLGLSCEETAVATGVPVSTVKTRMFHARRKMRQTLEASGMPLSERKDKSNDQD